MRYVLLLFFCFLTCVHADTKITQQIKYTNQNYPYHTWTYYLDGASWKTLKVILDEKSGDRTKELRDLYCNGSSPKIKVKQLIKFKPKIASNVALDKTMDSVGSQMIMADYFYGHDFLYMSGDGKDLSQYMDSSSFREKRKFRSSEYSDFENQNYYAAADMYLLLKNFTYKLPESIIAEMHGSDDDFKMNEFGYRDGKFLASEAIYFKDYIWRYVLIHDTEMKKAPQEDGSIAYEINWIPTLFCKYAISLDDLKTR